MSARALRVATLALAWAAVGSSAQPAPAQMAAPLEGEVRALPAIHEWKLKNGLTVAHVERPGLPMVAVQVWYRFGSADEPAGPHGVARSFERLMFMGSEGVRSEDHRHFIERAGGETSAIVTEDVSAFHNALPVEYFDLALSLEADRMGRLLIRGEALDEIRPAMLEDVRREQSNPVLRAYQDLRSLAFAGHPYAWPPAGVAADIEKLTSQDVKAVYHAYFVPGNALVVVVGGLPTDAAVRSVERWFGPLPAGKEPSRERGTGMVEPVQAERRQVLGGSPIRLVMAGYRLPPVSDPDVLALQVAGAVLTGGPASRLQRRLVGAKLADEVGGQVLVHRDGGMLVAFARPAAGSPAALEKALVAEVERLAVQGPSAAELSRARGQILGAAWFGLESATGLANQIGLSWALTGKTAGFLADLDTLEKVGAAQVKRAAGTYLARNRLTMIVAQPGSAAPSGSTP